MKEVDSPPENATGVHSDLIVALGHLGIHAKQIVTRYSDVYVMCRDAFQASAVQDAGPWKHMATVDRTNPDHPDAKEFPYLVDIPFANLAGFMNQRRRQDFPE